MKPPVVDPRPWLGWKFQQGGRTQDGVDCLGLSLLVAAHYGVPFRDPWSEIREKFGAGWRDFADLAPEGWCMLERATPIQALDLVVMGVPGTPEHISIAVDQWSLLHAAAGHGSGLVRHRWSADRILWVWRNEKFLEVKA